MHSWVLLAGQASGQTPGPSSEAGGGPAVRQQLHPSAVVGSMHDAALGSSVSCPGRLDAAALGACGALASLDPLARASPPRAHSRRPLPAQISTSLPANEWANAALAPVGGKGGGRPTVAQVRGEEREGGERSCVNSCGAFEPPWQLLLFAHVGAGNAHAWPCCGCHTCWALVGVRVWCWAGACPGTLLGAVWCGARRGRAVTSPQWTRQ